MAGNGYKAEFEVEPKSLSNRLAGWLGLSNFIGGLVVPSSALSDTQLDDKMGQASFKANVMNISYGLGLGREVESLCNATSVTTPDGAILETFSLDANGGRSLGVPITSSGKTVIFSMQNAALCQEFIGNNQELVADLLSEGHRIVLYNYRGVGGSTGYPSRPEDLVTDLRSQVAALEAQGIKAENIKLYGTSLGGAVSAAAADKLNQESKPVSVFCDRTFGQLTNAAEEIVKQEAEKRGGMLGRISSYIAKVAKSLMKAAGWELNTAEHYNNIPEGFKDYRNVEGDRIISADLSLHNHVNQLGKMIEPQVEPRHKKEDPHNISIYQLDRGESLKAFVGSDRAVQAGESANPKELEVGQGQHQPLHAPSHEAKSALKLQQPFSNTTLGVTQNPQGEKLGELTPEVGANGISSGRNTGRG